MSDPTEPDVAEALAASLIGRTIRNARWFPSPLTPGAGYERAWLWLDDGRVVEFDAWCYGDGGATIREVAEGEIADEGQR